MGKYTIHKDGNAGPYLAIEPRDISEVETMLKNLDITYFKGSHVVDGEEAGKDYLRVINIDNEKHTQLQNELDTHFAE